MEFIVALVVGFFRFHQPLHIIKISTYILHSEDNKLAPGSSLATSK